MKTQILRTQKSHVRLKETFAGVLDISKSLSLFRQQQQFIVVNQVLHQQLVMLTLTLTQAVQKSQQCLRAMRGDIDVRRVQATARDWLGRNP